MKKMQFRIGLLTACLIGVGSTASGQSCGGKGCDAKPCKCSCKTCDDRGLLEVINNAASSFESKLADMIPDLENGVTPSTCGCSKCKSVGEVTAEHSGAGSGIPKVPPLSRKNAAHAPASKMTVPQPAQPPLKIPTPRIPELIPLPDSSGDPFKDETTRNLRSIPSRPASNLRSNTNPPVDLDSQARSLKTPRSILMSAAATKSVSDHPLATTRSTRRTSKKPLVDIANIEVVDHIDPNLKQTVQEVVPASIDLPTSNLRYGAFPAPAAVEEFVNPLRAR